MPSDFAIHSDVLVYWTGEIVRGQLASGLGAAAYCRRGGIGEQSFYQWRRRVNAAGEPPTPPSAPFVEIAFPKPSSLLPSVPLPSASLPSVPLPSIPLPSVRLRSTGSAAIEVRLRRGRRLLVRDGFDRHLLVEPVHTLEAM